MKTSVAFVAPALFLSALIVGCGEKEDKKPAVKADEKAPAVADPVKKETPPEKKAEPSGAEKKEPAAVATKALNFGKGERKFTLQIPMGWKEEEPTNNMRLAQVKVPKAANDPEDAEVTAFQMSGGTVQQNLDRWAGQFGGAESMKGKKTLKTAAGGEAIVAEFEGNYTAMVAGTPEVKKDYKMLGAIIELDGGGEIYLKFIGPFNTIDAAKAAFDKVIESFKAAK